ncbi:hypothetical protein [Streptomyces sp. ISL-66]|nr:hypothetical protein [Streptomyces sp. ISL-66]
MGDAEASLDRGDRGAAADGSSFGEDGVHGGTVMFLNSIIES